MRVERLQHAVDGAVDQAVRRHFIDVLALDGRERGGEDAILLGDLVLPGRDVLAEQAADERRHRDSQDRRRQKSGVTHDGIVADR